MIVKNEEEILENCLNSCKNLFDEIVIVDTGSNDKTKQIASKYATKVLDFKWNYDFSKARNFSILNCNCDYFMWLDADDEITKENLEKLFELKNKLEIEKPDCVFIKYNTNFDENGNVTFSYFRERILKNDRINLFIDPVHEVIVPKGKILYFNDISIEHRKILKEKNLYKKILNKKDLNEKKIEKKEEIKKNLNKKKKFLNNKNNIKNVENIENSENNKNFDEKNEKLNKNDKNLKIKQQKLSKKQQNLIKKERLKNKTRNLKIYEKQNKKNFSPRQMFYYARELLYNEKYKKSIFWFNKFLKQKDGFFENKIEACLNLSEIYFILNEKEKAKQILFESFCYDTPRAEILCKIGEIYMDEKDFEKAIYYFDLATKTKLIKNSLAFINNDCYDFVPYIQMCVCYYYLGNIEKAIYYNNLAKKVKPNNKYVLFNEEFFNNFFREKS